MKKEIFEVILNKYQEELERDIIILSDVENVKVRLGVMKDLSIINITSFFESIFLCCQQLLEFSGCQFANICTVFGKSKKDKEYLLYQASFKSILVPLQEENADIIDILELQPQVSFYYLPKFYSLKDPYFQDYTIELIDDREDIMIFLKNYQRKINSDIIKVSKFRLEQKVEKDYVIVINVSLDKEDVYRKIKIS